MKHCSKHKELLEKGIATVICHRQQVLHELNVSPLERAELQREIDGVHLCFPHARLEVEGDAPGTTVAVWYCSACRAGIVQWLKQTETDLAQAKQEAEQALREAVELKAHLGIMVTLRERPGSSLQVFGTPIPVPDWGVYMGECLPPK
jgi:hypothetical protein